MTTLELTLVYLLAAVLGVVVFRSLKLPPMLGYLVVGVLIGPHALALGEHSEALRHIGEFGVVFLMFVIGLEFNLPKLRAMRQHVFGLGFSQVLLTIVLGTAGSLFLAVLAPSLWKMDWRTAVVLSGALAMSSTAIVVKLLSERLELAPEHGKREELFVLNLLFVTLGLAWITELAGLSLALGAFIAGMLISETEYKHQVETDIRPFHDVLLGLFFITIGMLLDWRLVAQHIGLVLLLLPV